MASIKSDKLWADAVRKAVHEYGQAKDQSGKVKKIRWLNLLAVTLVKKASEGDMQAMKEIGDRLDGKPAQAHDITHRQTVTEMSDDELIGIVQSARRGNGIAGAESGEEELPQIH